MRLLPFLLLIALAGPLAAADTAWQALQKAGITGRWALDCAASPSNDNWFSTYHASADGRAYFTVDRGPDRPAAITSIDEAAILTPTTLRWRLRYADKAWGSLDGVAFVVVSEFDNGKRMRTLSSTRSDGQVLIKDGKIAANGYPIPYEYKCSN